MVTFLGGENFLPLASIIVHGLMSFLSIAIGLIFTIFPSLTCTEIAPPTLFWVKISSGISQTSFLYFCLPASALAYIDNHAVFSHAFIPPTSLFLSGRSSA